MSSIGPIGPISPTCPADKAVQLHQDILMLWGRYRDLIRDLIVLQGQVADVVTEAQAAGKAIYELYGQTDAILDGEAKDSVQSVKSVSHPQTSIERSIV